MKIFKYKGVKQNTFYNGLKNMISHWTTRCLSPFMHLHPLPTRCLSSFLHLRPLPTRCLSSFLHLRPLPTSCILGDVQIIQHLLQTDTRNIILFCFINIHCNLLPIYKLSNVLPIISYNFLICQNFMINIMQFTKNITLLSFNEKNKNGFLINHQLDPDPKGVLS